MAAEDPRYLLPAVLFEASAALLFYRSGWALLPLLPVSCLLALRSREEMQRTRDRELAEQFVEALDAAVTALQAGASPENAFRDAYREMKVRFGERAPITRAFYRICAGLDSRVPLEDLLSAFAAGTGIEEVKEYAQVFAISKRRGGNMEGITQRSAELIRERMEAENEIAAALANRMMEQRIMNAVPFLIIAYISAVTPGFFDVLYHNMGGVLFMTLCLAVCVWAMELGSRILRSAF